MTRPFLAAALLAAAASAGAQAPAPCGPPSGCGMKSNVSSAPAIIVRPSARVGYLPVTAVRAGTAVALTLGGGAEAARAGDRVRLEVAEPVFARKVAVIERPAAAPGELARIDLGETIGSTGVVLVPPGSAAAGEVVAVRGGRLVLRLLWVRADGREVALRGQATAEARPGARVTGFLDEDIVPAQPLMPDMASFHGPIVPVAPTAVPKPPPAPAIVEPARPRADLESLVRAADYPEPARQAREEGRTGVRLEVGADGRVNGCSVRRSSGSSSLDSAACRILRSRARFVPARDSTGQPAPSSFDHDVAWTLPDGG